jgi:DNA-binding NtrC family response regulator
MSHDSHGGDQTATHETLEIAGTVRPARFVLEIQDDEGVRHVPIMTTPIVAGSSRSADLVIRDRTVSARHCELVLKGGGVNVRDLRSRNGTYVGGARVDEAWSPDGTTILVGQTTIVCTTASEESDDDVGRPLPGIAGASSIMCRLAAHVRRLALLNAPVLIRGESGVGKELIARALHSEGARASAPFVAINAATIPRELVETELFGHERGAFTGALNKRLGVFVEADGGTLFLDEIADLALDAQPKLLRALDGYEVRGVGTVGSGRRTNVRVVTATHVPLFDRVAEGLFRKDLYHRLEVFVLEVPPLRERRGDVLPIAKALLQRLDSEYGPRSLSPTAVAELTGHTWPGNVRELQATLMRAAVNAKAKGSAIIDAEAVRKAIRRTTTRSSSISPEQARDVLARHGNNVSAAARAAGVPRTTFRKLLGRADIAEDGE